MTELRLASIGECMIEMRKTGPASFEMGFGGDSANTAIYASRLLEGTGHKVEYITALGDDPYSDQIRAFLTSENIGIDHCGRLVGRMPGLYFIETNEAGERSFHYYRSEAAARDMFKGPGGEATLQALSSFDWIYFSGITLSVLDPTQRSALMDALAGARQAGRKIIFDGNFRPQSWPDLSTAQSAFTAALETSNIALVTFEDEQALHGDNTPENTLARLRQAGVVEGAVKLDHKGCLIFDEGGETLVAVEKVIERPVDTTSAGDSFNAGYLAARMTGQTPVAAGRAGNALAGIVIQYRGAVIPADCMP